MIKIHMYGVYCVCRFACVNISFDTMNHAHM